MHQKIIRQYYILSVIFNTIGMSFICATYVTFLQKNGLSLFEVNSVNAIFYLTLFICEIPTGAFADIFGRKKSFVIACAIISLSAFAYGLSHSYWQFVIAEILGGLGSTFRSGAFQAWLVDSLKHKGYEGGFTKIFARNNLMCQVGGGIGAVAGSHLAVYNITWPWFASGTGLAFLTLLAHFTMKEEYFQHSTFSWKKGFSTMKNIALSSARYGMNDKAVRFVLVITFIQILFVQALNMYWQPFFIGYKVSQKNMGYIFILIMASCAFGAFIITKIKTKGKEKSFIIKSQIAVGLLVICTAVVGNLPSAVILFLLHEMFRGWWSPLQESYLQERIPSHERATISSFCSIAPHIGGVFGLVLSGAVAQFFGVGASWIISGCILITGSLLIMKNGNHSQMNKK